MRRRLFGGRHRTAPVRRAADWRPTAMNHLLQSRRPRPGAAPGVTVYGAVCDAWSARRRSGRFCRRFGGFFSAPAARLARLSHVYAGLLNTLHTATIKSTAARTRVGLQPPLSPGRRWVRSRTPNLASTLHRGQKYQRGCRSDTHGGAPTTIGCAKIHSRLPRSSNQTPPRFLTESQLGWCVHERCSSQTVYRGDRRN